MKKVWILAFSLLVFLFSFNISFAEVLSPTPSPKVNYELPYPGILPDSSIYSLRMVRDKIVSFLISDPLKKAEFNLLQADKRLNAGIYLFNKGKVYLAVSTISKAENYFEQAIEKAKEARSKGMGINEITRKLIDSSKKHQEEIDSLTKRANKSFKASFETELKRVTEFQKENLETLK